MTHKIITPLRDKIFGKLIDDYGLKKSTGGVILHEKDGEANSIRPRWFEVTHVGPENKDFTVGEYVLVAHGRWSRSFNINEGDNTKFMHLDVAEILLKSDVNPSE